jgi:predicted enzyme related to lactoylglutathione lyase
MENRLLKQGAFSWNELLTTDVDAAKSFYSELLGWNTEDMPMESGSYTIVKVDDEQAGGIMAMPPQAEEMGAPPFWGVYITVDDVDATASKAAELGAKVLVPPQDIAGVGRFSTIQDPQGAVLSVIKYAPMEE